MDLPGQSLVVEITEGLLLDASAAVSNKLLQLRDAGIQVALDDFGTGYSSLSYLKKFDIDYLKIDRSFTRNLAPDSSDMALSDAIIVMAHKLGLKVIAEGRRNAGAARPAGRRRLRLWPGLSVCQAHAGRAIRFLPARRKVAGLIRVRERTEDNNYPDCLHHSQKRLKLLEQSILQMRLKALHWRLNDSQPNEETTMSLINTEIKPFKATAYHAASSST
jgi:hypothetical protein